MSGFKTFLENKEPEGTYAGFRLVPEDAKAVRDFAMSLGLPNPIEEDDIHITLLYSRTYIPSYEPLGDINEVCHPKQFRIFGEETRVLVIELDSDFCKARHKELMDFHKEATYDFDEYVPHLTLSYDMGDMPTPKSDHLLKLKDTLTIGKEYFEPLDFDKFG